MDSVSPLPGSPLAPSIELQHILFGFSRDEFHCVPRVFAYLLNLCKFLIWSQHNDFRFRSKPPSALELLACLRLEFASIYLCFSSARVFAYLLNLCKFLIWSQHNDFRFRSKPPSALELLACLRLEFASIYLCFSSASSLTAVVIFSTASGLPMVSLALSLGRRLISAFNLIILWLFCSSPVVLLCLSHILSPWLEALCWPSAYPRSGCCCCFLFIRVYLMLPLLAQLIVPCWSFIVLLALFLFTVVIGRFYFVGEVGLDSPAKLAGRSLVGVPPLLGGSLNYFSFLLLCF